MTIAGPLPKRASASDDFLSGFGGSKAVASHRTPKDRFAIKEMACWPAT